MGKAGKHITFNVEIVVEKDGDGYHAYCPALKGLHVGGDTVDEAVETAMDAAGWYLESMIHHGDPIPIGVCGSRGRRSRGTTANCR
jgi:predicted RNase H-like HicB family nuclease